MTVYNFLLSSANPSKTKFSLLELAIFTFAQDLSIGVLKRDFEGFWVHLCIWMIVFSILNDSAGGDRVSILGFLYEFIDFNCGYCFEPYIGSQQIWIGEKFTFSIANFWAACEGKELVGLV